MIAISYTGWAYPPPVSVPAYTIPPGLGALAGWVHWLGGRTGYTGYPVKIGYP